MNNAAQSLNHLGSIVIEDLLRQDPVAATWLGNHSFDDLLPDYSTENMSALAHRIEGYLTELDAIDDLELDLPELVDLEILRAHLLRTHFEITQVKAHTWNPMMWNPGTALHLLVSRDFAPRVEREANIAARAERIPQFLERARATLGTMPHIHCETAIAQLTGTRSLMQSLNLPDTTIEAVTEHIQWLNEQLSSSTKSPRMGPQLYAGILWNSLDSESSAESILDHAWAHLEIVTDRMRTKAVEFLEASGVAIPEGSDPIKIALERIAENSAVNDLNVVAYVENALKKSFEFVKDHDLVTVPDLDTQVIEMPEIHRGVAVAYCDAPGPLETSRLPTFVAVAPTPEDWSPERKESYYREYNATGIHDLTIHEAFPGHVLQLAHSNASETGRELSEIRKYGFSGVFVEGWAVYAEELMVTTGYSPDGTPLGNIACEVQQLKMQLRMTINAILDISVHTHDMTEDDAMGLMMTRGYQEEGEAAGKWRRALLTSGQLPTYFVGYHEIVNLVGDLRLLHPEWTWRELHDLVLQFGSPAPRHVRTLVGL